VWPSCDSGAVFPTCMKAIKRVAPPPGPAGLARTPEDARERWRSDDFRYPPYQYKEPCILWSPRGWRFLEAPERELLHGYGFLHTSVCYSASDIKRSYSDYEDQRCSLFGDSFNMYSFVIFAWASCMEWLPPLSYKHLCSRMGLAPGFCSPPCDSSPLVRSLSYGSPSGDCLSVSGLGKLLLARVNHTGSDVRGASGAVMNPRAYPRQSANPEWWNWKGVFSCRWARKEHINRLEMRSILLALRWRVQHLGEADCRFVHLTDSYVSMSVIFKGRSSSDMLMSVMRQVAAVEFAFNLYPILIHVESTSSPTDEASRL
jgi:hypothetical protein